jgi:hypothetical protein
VGVLGVGRPDFATVDHPIVAIAHGACRDAAGVSPGIGLGEREGYAHLPSGECGQIAPLFRVGAVLDNGHGREDAKMDRRPAGRPRTRGNELQ